MGLISLADWDSSTVVHAHMFDCLLIRFLLGGQAVLQLGLSHPSCTSVVQGVAFQFQCDICWFCICMMNTTIQNRHLQVMLARSTEHLCFQRPADAGCCAPDFPLILTSGITQNNVKCIVCSRIKWGFRLSTSAA